MAAFSVQVGHATIITIDTTSLTPATDYYLYFNLIDLDGLDIGNNTATITSFGLSGGTLLSDPEFGSGFVGGLATTLTLTDSTTTDYAVKFHAGSSLQFDLTLTSFLDSPATPDGFSLSIYDAAFIPLVTAANDGFGTLLQQDIGAGPLNAYSLTSVVPEPSVALLFLTGGLMIFARRRAQARRA